MNAAEVQLSLALDLAQGRLLTEALAERPFRTVCILIGRLNAWASHALAHGAAARHALPPFTLTMAELSLTLQALVELPYRRVHALVASLQYQMQQIQQQLAVNEQTDQALALPVDG